MKKFVTADILNAPYLGGLPLVWDDLLFVQNSINTAISQISKSIGAETIMYILAGCTTRKWVGYINTLDFELSEGVIVINGEPIRFNGFDANIYPSTHIWFTISRDDIGGQKVIEANNDVVNCYTENRLVLNHGTAYPAGTVNVDYYPIEQKYNESRPAIDYLYEIISSNIKYVTKNVTITPFNDFNTTNLIVKSCANSVNIRGTVITNDVIDEDIIMCELSEVVVSGTGGGRAHYFFANYKNEDNSINGIANCYMSGNKLFIGRNTNIGPGYAIQIGTSFLIS